MTALPRKEFDLAAYAERSQNSPCFVCAVVNGEPGYDDHGVFHDDGDTIGFLNKYPTLLGYSLVCPKRHIEDIAEDLTEAEYLATQAVAQASSEPDRFRRQRPRQRILVPRRHVEDFVDDMGLDEYLAAQELVYRVAAAVKRAVSADTVVVSSMGGLPGATHVGWNLMPISPPDLSQTAPVPFPDLDPETLRDLAARLGDALAPRKY